MTSRRTNPDTLAQAYRSACQLELDALKPGNVHIHADGHGMTVEDFRRSADLTAPVLAGPARACGARIRDAVEITMTEIGYNTNLGILLLAAPLLTAAPNAKTAGGLPGALRNVLDNLSMQDADDVYAAIRRAAPGGLGRAEQHDVHGEPSAPLQDAMAAAANRDNIARQYAEGFSDVFGLGVAAWRRARSRRWSAPWSAAYVYMTFLATQTDSHVLRKFDAETAARLRKQAQGEIKRLESVSNPDELELSWLQFDDDLKRNDINPGTSADLTVATLLAAQLQDML